MVSLRSASLKHSGRFELLPCPWGAGHSAALSQNVDMIQMVQCKKHGGRARIFNFSAYGMQYAADCFCETTRTRAPPHAPPKDAAAEPPFSLPHVTAAHLSRHVVAVAYAHTKHMSRCQMSYCLRFPPPRRPGPQNSRQQQRRPPPPPPRRKSRPRKRVSLFFLMAFERCMYTSRGAHNQSRVLVPHLKIAVVSTPCRLVYACSIARLRGFSDSGFFPLRRVF